MRAFFVKETLSISRTFELADFLGHGDHVTIGTDASPFCRGGWMSINGYVTEFFASKVQPNDEVILGVRQGCHESQQTLEFLAILVALRVWLAPSSDPSRRRVQLTVRGDNTGALSLTNKLRPKGPKMAIIAREVALVLAGLSFPPRVHHTPGVAHVLADALSRITTDDDKILTEHPALKNATRRFPPTRNRSWYRALNSSS